MLMKAGNMELCILKIRVITREELRRGRQMGMELWCLGILIDIRANSAKANLMERVQYQILKVNQHLKVILNKVVHNQAS